MSHGNRSRGGTNRHFIHVGPLPEIEVSSSSVHYHGHMYTYHIIQVFIVVVHALR